MYDLTLGGHGGGGQAGTGVHT
jgi:hypothetical protein